MTPDEEVELATDTCTKCHGRHLKFRGIEHEQEIEVVRKRKVTESTMSVYDCLDCKETVRALLPNGCAPSGYRVE